MRKYFLIVFVVFALAAPALASDAIDQGERSFAFNPLSHAAGISDSFVFINTGVGFPTMNFLNMVGHSRGGYGYTFTRIPAMSVSVDFALPAVLPLGLPVSVGAFYNAAKYNNHRRADNSREHGWYKGVGARFAWHFDFGVRNLDTYVGTAVGMVVHAQRNENWLNPATDHGFTHYNSFFGLHIGARYFVDDRVGMFAELGFNQVTMAVFGLTVKF